MITRDLLKKAFDAGLDEFIRTINRELKSAEPKTQGELLPVEDTEGKKVSRLIAVYCSAYKKRYGEKARPDVGGKSIGVLKRVLRGYSEEQVATLLQVYLQLEEEWFRTKYYDLVTFETSLQRVLHAATTGQRGAQTSGMDAFMAAPDKPKELT